MRPEPRKRLLARGESRWNFRDERGITGEKSRDKRAIASGDAAGVAMAQSADLRDGDDLAALGGLNFAR